MQKILVIVDMQTKVPAAKHRATIDGCKAEITAAIAGNIPIFILELKSDQDFGPTLPELTNMLKGYANAHTVIKQQNDGSYILRQKFHDLGLQPEFQFIVCGINTEACVYETIDGLLCKFPKSKATIDRNAVNGNHNQHEQFGYLRFLEFMEHRITIEPAFKNTFKKDYDQDEIDGIGESILHDRGFNDWIAQKIDTVGFDTADKEIHLRMQDAENHRMKELRQMFGDGVLDLMRL